MTHPGPKSQKGKGVGKAALKSFARDTSTSNSTLLMHSNLDKKFIYDLSKKLYRVEYPGCVQNEEEALKTLGGIQGIENAVSDIRNKLEIHFHPNNLFNKSCTADVDPNPGILIKVVEKSDRNNLDPEDNPYEYEVVGITNLNFTFNNMCDFQYLPLVPKDLNETSESDVEFIYENIFPQEVPNLSWFLKKEIMEQPEFCLPTIFARFETPHNRIFLNAGEKYESYVRPDVIQNIKTSADSSKPRKKKALVTTQISCFVDFTKPNAKIPDEPMAKCLELVKEKFLEKQYAVLDKLFQERPIWTKSAVQYRTNYNTDYYKILLPAVAYFCNIGPWRNCWIRYGYNPQEDINSRIYQILDFRIRATEGLKLKINAKRGATKVLSHPIKKNIFHNKPSNKSSKVEENYFILKPDTLPPARQMMYQFCDIQIPEVQEMLSRLPKVQPNIKYHGKYGWLPVNFTEQCRELANQYIMNTVQEHLLADYVSVDSNEETTSDISKSQNVSLYASKMLSNIRKGVHSSEDQGETSKSAESKETDFIDLADDEEIDQIDAFEFVNSIPAHIPEHSDDDSDMEIDTEALEEVNQLVMGPQEGEDDMNIVTGFLKDL